jgi:hypothetical protein
VDIDFSILLVDETGVPGENHQPVASHWQTLAHNVVSSTPRHERGSNSQLKSCFELNLLINKLITQNQFL